MANIAQTVNVLQAMILTDKEKMILTPTYHVFEMYKVHQGGTSLPVELTVAGLRASEQKKIPKLSASATRVEDESGDPPLARQHQPDAAGQGVGQADRRPPKAYGPNPDRGEDRRAQHLRRAAQVKPAAFNGASLEGGSLKVTLPARAVVILTLK